MSYANFKPIIWSKVIQTALHEKIILADFCNKEFEGDAKLGGTVKIIGAAAPTIYAYDPDVGLNDPETQEGSAVMLNIDQADAFNVKVDDVDASQMNGAKLLPVLCSEASALLAAKADRFIAKIAATADGVVTSASQALGTAKKVKEAIDEGILHLREKNVDPSTEARIELPWWMYQIFKNELTEDKTSNDALIAKGVVGWYDGFKVVASNCLYNDGTDDHAIIRTKKAVAFANTITETEAYRPEKFFSDAVKGLNVYGGTVCRKDELYIIKGHKG